MKAVGILASALILAATAAAAQTFPANEKAPLRIEDARLQGRSL